MRQIKFDQDFDWNIDGSKHGKRSNEEGDVLRLGDSMADKLVNHWQVAHYHETGPSETKQQPKQEVKIDFSDLPRADKLSTGGFDILDAVNNASDEELLAVDGIGKATLKDIRGFFN